MDHAKRVSDSRLWPRRLQGIKLSCQHFYGSQSVRWARHNSACHGYTGTRLADTMNMWPQPQLTQDPANAGQCTSARRATRLGGWTRVVACVGDSLRAQRLQACQRCVTFCAAYHERILVPHELPGIHLLCAREPERAARTHRAGPETLPRAGAPGFQRGQPSYWSGAAAKTATSAR